MQTPLLDRALSDAHAAVGYAETVAKNQFTKLAIAADAELAKLEASIQERVWLAGIASLAVGVVIGNCVRPFI